MKEPFLDYSFRPSTLTLIHQCESILDDYALQGYDLTLRQLYYQLVSNNIIPNLDKEYKKLGKTITKARNAGLIDWNMIVDRGRRPHGLMTWRSPAHRIRSAARTFRIDKWDNQSIHIEVMVEKEALAGVLIPVCDELQVNFHSNKGYSSASALYSLAKDLEQYAQEEEKELHILYLGDHDPSGLDMDRDIVERLELYTNYQIVEVKRLALLMAQIDQMDIPPNPAKLSDSRARGYIALHGYSSWELDAMEPAALADLVRNEVHELRDDALWLAAEESEKKMRQKLVDVSRQMNQKL